MNIRRLLEAVVEKDIGVVDKIFELTRNWLGGGGGTQLTCCNTPSFFNSPGINKSIRVAKCDHAIVRVYFLYGRIVCVDFVCVTDLFCIFACHVFMLELLVYLFLFLPPA